MLIVEYLEGCLAQYSWYHVEWFFVNSKPSPASESQYQTRTWSTETPTSFIRHAEELAVPTEADLRVPPTDLVRHQLIGDRELAADAVERSAETVGLDVGKIDRVVEEFLDRDGSVRDGLEDLHVRLVGREGHRDRVLERGAVAKRGELKRLSG